MEKQPEGSKEGKGERYAGRTEDEWRDWGASFGKRMDRIGKEVGDEMEDWGERFGDYMDQKGRRWERKWQRKWERKWERRMRGRWYDVFGIIGPLLGSILSIIILLIATLVLDLINGTAHSAFIGAVTGFVYAYLFLFFALSLFFGYGRYFIRHYPATRWVIRPITGAAGITFVAWIAVFALNLANNYSKSATIDAAATFLDQNLLGIFVVFLILGYFFSVIAWMVRGVMGD